MGVISKSYLSSSPSNLSDGFFRLKHSPLRNDHDVLHFMQSLPLYWTHPGEYGKHINSHKKCLLSHRVQTPLLYYSQYLSFFWHWKNLFKKYSSLQAKHCPCFFISMQLSSATSHSPDDISMYPLSHASQSPSSLYLRHDGSSLAQVSPCFKW